MEQKQPPPRHTRKKKTYAQQKAHAPPSLIREHCEAPAVRKHTHTNSHPLPTSTKIHTKKEDTHLPVSDELDAIVRTGHFATGDRAVLVQMNLLPRSRQSGAEVAQASSRRAWHYKRFESDGRGEAERRRRTGRARQLSSPARNMGGVLPADLSVGCVRVSVTVQA